MGDRGGTATPTPTSTNSINYTRWEIGGKPQLGGSDPSAYHIIPDGRSGGNRNVASMVHLQEELYPMGDRGGTATLSPGIRCLGSLYPMGDRGGTATHCKMHVLLLRLYPMGDRGGTATRHPVVDHPANYTRWEIGGEPQHNIININFSFIIPDGRSGGNRNEQRLQELERELYPMGDRGGTATHRSGRKSSG